MSTSTPLCEIEDGDSGYHSNLSNTCTSDNHSNLSGTCTSVDYSLPADRSRLSRYFRTTLIAKKHVDFIHCLSNYTLIVKKILEYLSDEDLYSATNVSKIWKKVVLAIPVQRKRYRLYAKKLEFTKENRVANNESSACEDKSVLELRGTLAEIQNISRLSSNSPRSSASPVSVSHRFEAYQTEAQRLKVGKRLFSCPKCNLPAQVQENELQTAVCTNTNCLYEFCALCHCVVHPTRMCNFISTPMVRKQASLVGTRTSKKNLKRLLL